MTELDRLSSDANDRAGTCFIKFGAVRDTPSAEKDYLRLLDACGALAVAVGMGSVLAGARKQAALHGFLKPAVDRLAALDAERQDGFRKDLGTTTIPRGSRA